MTTKLILTDYIRKKVSIKMMKTTRKRKRRKGKRERKKRKRKRSIRKTEEIPFHQKRTPLSLSGLSHV